MARNISVRRLGCTLDACLDLNKKAEDAVMDLLRTSLLVALSCAVMSVQAAESRGLSAESCKLFLK